MLRKYRERRKRRRRRRGNSTIPLRTESRAIKHLVRHLLGASAMLNPVSGFEERIMRNDSLPCKAHSVVISSKS